MWQNFDQGPSTYEILIKFQIALNLNIHWYPLYHQSDHTKILHITRYLTHWGWVMHICICNLTIIGSDNGLSPGRCPAIIWTNAGILSIKPLGTNFSEILFEKVICKMAVILSQPQCVKLSCCGQNFVVIISVFLNSLWPNDVIWRHRHGWTFAQVMACYLN